MKKAKYLSDISIIRSVFCPSTNLLVIFDPLKLLQQDCSQDFLIFYKIDDLQLFLDTYPKKKAIVFNLSSKALSLQEKNVKFLVDFNPTTKDLEAQSFYFINNPNGTMRWISPSSNSKPTFLNLYNSSGLKAKLFKLGIKTAYFFKQQQRVISGQFTIYNKEPLALEEQIKKMDANQYSIFTGTVGLNRKAIIELNKEGKTTHFIKLPLSLNARALVLNEFIHLEFLEKLKLKKMVIPKVQRFENSIALSNIQPTKSTQQNKLNRVHLSALYELYNRTKEVAAIEDLPIWNKINVQLSRCKKVSPNNGITVEQYSKLTNLLERTENKIKANKQISVAIAHGDFTPWNMYLSKSTIHLYDWEMTAKQYPLLFDAFHYIFQSEILIHKTSFKQIKEQLIQLRAMPTCQAIIEEYQINFDLAYQLYLLYTISYYLELYLKQEKLHEQAHWLLNCWTEALTDLLHNEGLKHEKKASKMKNIS